MLRRTFYSVDRVEVDRFVAENECVGSWLGKFAESCSRRLVFLVASP